MVALILALLEQPDHIADITACLEAAGYKVCVTGTFSSAKKLLQDSGFDLIISDVHLQNGGSVFDFLKWVKSREDLQAIPFVLLTVEPTKVAKYLADGVSAAARQMGAAKCITMEIFDGAFFAKEIDELLNDANPAHILAKKGE
jgi:CheY-like chemotaxis protein